MGSFRVYMPYYTEKRSSSSTMVDKLISHQQTVSARTIHRTQAVEDNRSLQQPLMWVLPPL